MKNFVSVLVLVSSFSAFAFGPNTDGTGRSDFRVVAEARKGLEADLSEQFVANTTSLAAFLQSEAAYASTADIAEIAETSRRVLHERVQALTDREAIMKALKK